MGDEEREKTAFSRLPTGLRQGGVLLVVYRRAGALLARRRVLGLRRRAQARGAFGRGVSLGCDRNPAFRSRRRIGFPSRMPRGSEQGARRPGFVALVSRDAPQRARSNPW